MSTLYALIIVTSLGVTEGYTFASLKDCQEASNRVRDSFCVAKEPVNTRAEIDKMFGLLQYMKSRMETLQ